MQVTQRAVRREFEHGAVIGRAAITCRAVEIAICGLHEASFRIRSVVGAGKGSQCCEDGRTLGTRRQQAEQKGSDKFHSQELICGGRVMLSYIS